MGIPVRLKIDNFSYLGEKFKKGEIFNAPHEAYASFICEQEGNAVRVNDADCNPEKVGTMQRTLKKNSYNTKVMEPGDNTGKPVVTKTKQRPAKEKSTAKANVNAAKDNT